jgi:hypothetical protein
MNKKGQAGAQALIVLAVSAIIGAYLIGNVYEATYSDQVASVTSAMDDSLDNAVTGITLLSVALIVGAAVFILKTIGG